MSGEGRSPPASPLDALLRAQRGRLVARLARRFGLDRLGLAEDAVQTACERALLVWPRDGTPDAPAAWLYRVAQRACIDALRQTAPWQPLEDDDAAAAQLPAAPASRSERFAGELDDEELALLFAACHPALPPPTQVAIALRALVGLDLETLAAGLLTTPAALAQRLARARERLADASLAVPAGAELAPRRETVLRTLLVMFNAGWSADARRARALCWEAIRLARALAAHRATAHPDADALAALLLLHGARLTGRQDSAGERVPLPGQPRDRWDQGMLRLGAVHLQRAQAATAASRWHLLAGIAAAHAMAPDYARTPWSRIVSLYDALLRIEPGAAPRLSHAIALAEAGDPIRARDLLLDLQPEVPDALRPHLHAALSHALDRLGDRDAARAQLDAAIAQAPEGADRRLLQRRLQARFGPGPGSDTPP